jgi:hypothetical protein
MNRDLYKSTEQDAPKLGLVEINEEICKAKRIYELM